MNAAEYMPEYREHLQLQLPIHRVPYLYCVSVCVYMYECRLYVSGRVRVYGFSHSVQPSAADMHSIRAQISAHGMQTR